MNKYLINKNLKLQIKYKERFVSFFSKNNKSTQPKRISLRILTLGNKEHFYW